MKMVDEQRDQAGSPAGDAPRPSVDDRMARLTTREAFLGLQLFTTGVGSLCGVLFFVLLTGWRANGPLAALLGLIVALAARRAFSWLLLFWLTTRASRGGPPA
jgi:hypothetical protein